jgi:hypothetical protein
VKDRIKDREISVEYCPTEHMIVDYLTKPLQGSQFETFCNRIMNYNPDEDSNLDYRSVLKEAEAEVRTDNEWTLLQYQCKGPKVELDSGDTKVRDYDNNYDHGSNQITRVNKDAKWIDKNRNTLNNSAHDREWNQGCETIRDRQDHDQSEVKWLKWKVKNSSYIYV